MKLIIEKLQSHPLIILLMFCVSLLGGTMAIITGWEEFYTSFLSKPLTIPVWLLLLSIFLLVIIFVFRPQRKKPFVTKLETVEGKVFGVEQIVLDGKRFVNCTFDGSELIFNGTNSFSLESNVFENSPRISFQQHAGMTLQVIKILYDSPEFNEYIEKTLKDKVANG